MQENISSTYEVIGKIGEGGGGTVFLANHLRLGKKVVLKADKRKLSTRPEQLRREVDVLKDLRYTHIPQVYDFFVEEETVYTAMDYIEGESLDKPLKRGERFSQAQVIKWAKQLLGALDYLHSPTHGTPPRGFVHSDIKPANLMRTASNDICLIDFNIALALGEESIIGCSIGYASPEHYGLDFSSKYERETQGYSTAVQIDSDKTVITDGEDETIAEVADKEKSAQVRGTSSSMLKRVIVPDVRSDIYSTGATLYHLLKGERPAKNAKEVIPLSKEEFSPQIVDIISKSMNPNPDLRYQSAQEMLQDFLNLRKNDIRVRRLKRNGWAAGILFSMVFMVGVATSFVGLKRIQTTESWLKLVEYAKDALSIGDTESALAYALQTFPEETNLVVPSLVGEAQRVMAEALGVYDLKDGFHSHKTFDLPSVPLAMTASPDGKTAVCLYAWEVAVVDTESAKVLVRLPAEPSALSEVEYLDNHTLVYAGKDGVTVYDIKQEKTRWTGNAATAISISEDRKIIATVYKEETFATIYQAEDGKILRTVDFEGKCQSVTVNDTFANPNDNLLALNHDGSMLGVSFSDGSLLVYDLKDSEGDLLLFDETSGYHHFEGGFYQQYFALSASSTSESVFAIIDTEEMIQTGGFDSQSSFGVQTDENGIYVQTEHILVKIHPVTGEQTPLVTTDESIQRFARNGQYALIASEKNLQFFNEYSALVFSVEQEQDIHFVQLAGDMALVGSMDSPTIRMMQYEHYPEQEIFSYDPVYLHDEARISADGKTVTLFRYDQFRVYSIDGELIKEVSVLNADYVYDQQFVREGTESHLEVIYNDGSVIAYSAADGSKLWEKIGETKDKSLYEEFLVNGLRIESPLHGAPTVYDIETGKLVRQLEEDAYLTYVTPVGEYLIVQYVTADGYCYGQLLNGKCEVLADLPYLCDVIGEQLFFDYPTGNVRETRLYDRDELIEMAREVLRGGV